MAKSGILLKDDVLTKFNDQKLKKTCQVIVYKISDDKKTIEIENEIAEIGWSDFVASLPEKESRYATFDYPYTGTGGAENKGLIFIAWCPDTAPPRTKMMHASSKDTIRKKLDGIVCEIQATDNGDLAETVVTEKVLKTKRT